MTDADKSDKPQTPPTTMVFAGDAAQAYAAFNLRDPYYPEMAGHVLNLALARHGEEYLGWAVDLGAGIGISTMVFHRYADKTFAVEPESAMRAMCSLNVLGDPNVRVLEGRGENLAETLGADAGMIDTVLCSQAFHLFNPPGKPSLVPEVMRQVAEVLRSEGVFAFDLGPSNYAFKIQLQDHREPVSDDNPGIMTELGHPLYREAEKAVKRSLVNRGIVREEDLPESLWPAAAARMDFLYLRTYAQRAGFQDLEVTEVLVPITGDRVIEFIRNSWTVFFRWGELSKLPMEVKMAVMGDALRELFSENCVERYKHVCAYHPTAVLTCVKS